MKNADKTLQTLTGTAIPLSALKTEESCGCGEFLDLIPFADFCAKCGLKLIQLLPVNDTGTESSPYSALSAFALNPIYIRLQALPEAAAFADEIKKLIDTHSVNKRFDYKKLRHDKTDLLVKIFAASKDQIMQDKKLSSWIRANPWIINYAVFMEKKRENLEASCKSWKTFKNPTPQQIKAEWDNPAKKMNHWFFAWLQMRLDEQFSTASQKVKAKGLLLKGDIPIMMNEDSADVWANPDCFIDGLRAGSPPDDYNPVGQNWGFPIYDWDYQKKDNFSWWKARLATASKYYQAYRIDHVLGFFRIWAVPKGEHTAVLGHTQPLVTVSFSELEKLGFDPMRIRWLS
ncbi:MAG: 4-alpha-glucanotransferase, partial [Spirochaetaceae bacterium]|nr:4-alpha-glucanotransferase [Spirochaetaceae bacterium]